MFLVEQYILKILLVIQFLKIQLRMDSNVITIVFLGVGSLFMEMRFMK